MLKSRRGLDMGKMYAFQDITKQKMMYNALENMSAYDQLTGFYTGRIFASKLAEWDKEPEEYIKYAVMDLLLKKGKDSARQRREMTAALTEEYFRNEYESLEHVNRIKALAAGMADKQWLSIWTVGREDSPSFKNSCHCGFF